VRVILSTSYSSILPQSHKTHTIANCYSFKVARGVFSLCVCVLSVLCVAACCCQCTFTNVHHSHPPFTFPFPFSVTFPFSFCLTWPEVHYSLFATKAIIFFNVVVAAQFLLIYIDEMCYGCNNNNSSGTIAITMTITGSSRLFVILPRTIRQFSWPCPTKFLMIVWEFSFPLSLFVFCNGKAFFLVCF